MENSLLHVADEKDESFKMPAIIKPLPLKRELKNKTSKGRKDKRCYFGKK